MQVNGSQTIIPISEEFLDYGNAIADQLEKERIRVEIDDRELSLGKKIRAAEKLWTPIIVVVGEKERKQQTCDQEQENRTK